MKEYPKILGPYYEDTPWGEECIAFDKLDGSNLRFEWNPKRGWYKFGTRRRMFDRNDPEYGIAIDIFLKKYGDAVVNVFRDKYPKAESAIAYAEFFGQYSFGGKHDNQWLQDVGLISNNQNNDLKDVVLFDINIHKKGFISPFDFVEFFSHLHIPQVIYRGILTEEFVQEVRNDQHSVVEGVICKGGNGHNLWMRKIKTFSYLKKIQEVFGTGWENFWE